MLKKNTIAILPQNGYYNNQNHSVKAIKWLENFAFKNNSKILHARNGGEKRINGLLVDGFDEKTNTVYQFSGCYWHACPKCFNATTYNKVKLKSLGAIYKTHLKIMNKLKSTENLVVIEIWECEFDLMCKKDEVLKEFLKTIDIKMPLNVRDSFFGGRTKTFKLHHLCKDDEKIKYYDITSLYPYVQSYNKFPVGHPEIILTEFESIANYFGFVKLTILPARNFIFQCCQ